jgi:hypothetical protein
MCAGAICWWSSRNVLASGTFGREAVVDTVRMIKDRFGVVEGTTPREND